MVHQKTSAGKAVTKIPIKKASRQKSYPWLFLALLVIFVATFTVISYLIFFDKNEEPPVEIIEDGVTEESAYVSPETTEVKPEKIDFQTVVNEWVRSVSGNKSVMIYDLDRDELVGSYNSKENYGTASLYKLFVVYEGYRRLESGEWQADEPAGSTGYTVLECLDLAIRESYSPCAETLWAEIGHDELDKIIKTDFGIANSDISVLTSNPEDIMKMMKLFYEHSDINDEVLVANMKDSFLNQPKTEYNWRQGLPSGFSDTVNVYNKVGWEFNENGNYWNIYHDAAIVEFPEKDRHFIVVAMTNKVPYQQIRKLGSMVEKEFNKY